MRKIIRLTFFILIGTANVSLAGGIFDKPFSICSSIQNLGAYKLTKAVVSKCENYGVHIDFKKAKNSFDLMVTEEQLSVSECNIKCSVLNALDNTAMSSCVEKSFVDSFV